MKLNRKEIEALKHHLKNKENYILSYIPNTAYYSALGYSEISSIPLINTIQVNSKNRTFIMVLNRFMWEDIEKGTHKQGKRIRCAIKFEGILKVK